MALGFPENTGGCRLSVLHRCALAPAAKEHDASPQGRAAALTLGCRATWRGFTSKSLNPTVCHAGGGSPRCGCGSGASGGLPLPHQRLDQRPELGAAGAQLASAAVEYRGHVHRRLVESIVDHDKVKLVVVRHV